MKYSCTLLTAALSIAGLAAAQPAFAHAYLKSAVPVPGSVITHAPKNLLLVFTEDLEVPFCKVRITSGSGVNEAGKPQPVAGHRNELRVPFETAAPGRYRVTWHALSVDTHKTHGSYAFTVRG